MTWFKTRLYFTSVVAIMLLAYLFYLLHDDKYQSGQQRSEVLLQLQVLDNALDLEVLRISSMQQQNYDEIVRLTRQLKLQETDPDTASLFVELPAELSGKLRQYRQTLDQRARLAERIKTLAEIGRAHV